jgi:hypothetical protein
LYQQKKTGKKYNFYGWHVACVYWGGAFSGEVAMLRIRICINMQSKLHKYAFSGSGIAR